MSAEISTCRLPACPVAEPRSLVVSYRAHAPAMPIHGTGDRTRAWRDDRAFAKRAWGIAPTCTVLATAHARRRPPERSP